MMNTLTYAVPKKEDENPILRKGECHKDSEHGDWHFMSPDGGHFCVLGQNVKITRRGLTICEDKVPTYANVRSGHNVENFWTVKNDEWKGFSAHSV